MWRVAPFLLVEVGVFETLEDVLTLAVGATTLENNGRGFFNCNFRSLFTNLVGDADFTRTTDGVGDVTLVEGLFLTHVFLAPAADDEHG